MDKIYDLLTKQLLSQPFPYKEILKKQLDTAKYDIEAYEDALKSCFVQTVIRSAYRSCCTLFQFPGNYSPPGAAWDAIYL